MMKQLVLDIRPDAPPTLENFVAGSNAELVATVSLLASPATAVVFSQPKFEFANSTGEDADKSEKIYPAVEAVAPQL